MDKRQQVIFKIMIMILLILISIIATRGAINIPVDKFGSVLIKSPDIPEVWLQVFWQIRFPKIVAAFLAGASLSVCGLLMQTFFRNPLADPFVLGVHSGSSLGVALWIMGTSYIPFLMNESIQNLGMVFFAILGGVITLFLLLLLSKQIPGRSVLLVMGLVFGHFSSGIINILISVSDANKIKNFLLWTLGSFQRVSDDRLLIFSIVIIIGLMVSFIFKKDLNVMVLGERYSKSLGLSINRTKYFLICITAILSGVVTAFCGPIVFIGIITPHLFRKIIQSSDHTILLPGVILLGGIIALFAELISSFHDGMIIPVNAVLGLLGVPVIIAFLWKNRKGEMG